MRKYILLAIFPLLGCQGPAEPEIRRSAWLGHVPQLTSPDTVRVGVPFSATVVSVIGATGYCTKPDGATVSNQAQVARVELFVRENRGQACLTDVVHYHPLAVVITFDSLGTATIRVIGETFREGALVRDSVERSVVVVP